MLSLNDDLSSTCLARARVWRYVHIQAIKCHPCGAIRLAQRTPCWQWLRSVEHTDIIQAKETAFKYICPFCVFAVDPPSKVKEQFLEYAFKERDILAAMHLPLNLKHAERCPRMHRWVDIREVPLVCGDLPVRFHVPFTSEQVKLLLGERRINHGKGNAVESAVPCCKIRIFPSVKSFIMPDLMVVATTYLSGIDNMSEA
jgi:hypothetical protein